MQADDACGLTVVRYTCLLPSFCFGESGSFQRLGHKMSWQNIKMLYFRSVITFFHDICNETFNCKLSDLLQKNNYVTICYLIMVVVVELR